MSASQTTATSANDEQKVKWYYDPKVRSVLYQLTFGLLVVLFFYYIYRNTLINLEERKIKVGFEFWSTTASFDIPFSLIEYNRSDSYGRVFWVGLWNTILVAGVGIFFATLVGFIVGVGRLSHNWLIAKICTVYVEIFRNIPLLLQILFWYFGVLNALPGPKQSIEAGAGIIINKRGMYVPEPIFNDAIYAVLVAFIIGLIGWIVLAKWAKKRQIDTGQTFPVLWSGIGGIAALMTLTGLIFGLQVEFIIPEFKGFNFRGGMILIPELIALTLALTIYTASYIAEIVRSGILSVSWGQSEAAYALGLRKGRTYRLIIIPQAMRVIIPQLTSQYLNLTKNSSLAVAIGYPELVAVFAGTTLNQVGQALEIIGLTMLVYLTLSLSTSIFMNWYNAKMALKER